MRRREFIRAFGGAAAVWPLMAFGQEALQPPLVAVLSPLSSDAAALNIQASAVAKATAGEPAARSKAFLYDEQGLPR